MIAELGDLSRFPNPRQLMAYLGLVPSEHSSGTSIRRGGLRPATAQHARYFDHLPRATDEETLHRQPVRQPSIVEIADTLMKRKRMDPTDDFSAASD